MRLGDVVVDWAGAGWTVGLLLGTGTAAAGDAPSVCQRGTIAGAVVGTGLGTAQS